MKNLYFQLPGLVPIACILFLTFSIRLPAQKITSGVITYKFESIVDGFNLDSIATTDTLDAELAFIINKLRGTTAGMPEVTYHFTAEKARDVRKQDKK